MRFVEAWSAEIWPAIQRDVERRLAAMPEQQNEDAVGSHYGSKIWELISEARPIRNVARNLAWTSPAANTPLQTGISLGAVETFAFGMCMPKRHAPAHPGG